ncbi:L-asparaginase [Sagittula marina]|uniref:L-asparaginase n=1 Tax=Sagittula marina TaxID=943940 RepID=A0A7W6DVY8_9RHOB|nr:asparaginase [Sagittula marina]MBB3987118.1 L-asparaginase [Sagittula marina]
MKQVVLISTGGTIASVSDHAGGPVNAALAGERLLDSLHQKPDGIAVRVEDFPARGSYALDLATIHALCARITETLADAAVAGVVVTHGTDTMEESAFLADLLVRSDKPVIFTGAQRHAGVADTDGPRNLGDAITCAASDALTGVGPVILFEGELHAARDVTKVHASRVDTFRSPGFGKLGDVDEGRVHIGRRPGARVTLSTPTLDPDVEIIAPGLGTTPRLLDHCGASGVSGVVIAGFGRGNAPMGFADAAKRLIDKGIPVIVATRCAEGRTMAVYGKDSGATTLVEAGCLLAGELSPYKARLLLAALLGQGATREEIAAAFARFA